MEDKQIVKIIRDFYESGWDASKVDGAEKVNSIDELCTGATILIRMTAPKDSLGHIDVVGIKEFENGAGFVNITKGTCTEFELYAHEGSYRVRLISKYPLPLCCGSEKHYFIPQFVIDNGILYNLTE